MNNSFLFLLVVIFLVFSRCAGDNALQFYDAKLVGSFSMIIPPDSKANLKSSKYLASENAIYGLNFDNQSIYINYLNDGADRYEKISLAEEGPAGVGKAYSLSVYSKDSIFLTN